MLKVIGGSLKGRRLGALKGLTMRPTAAALRETLFNLVGAEIDGSRFLDLCAGSGAVAIEALSRGARSACLVDNHPSSVTLIRRNLDSLGLSERAVVLRRDAPRAIAELAKKGRLFDCVFLDPPYDSDVAARCLRSPRWRDIIPARARIFVEHRRGQQWGEIGALEIIDTRKFGETVLTVCRGDFPE